jgi:hypothetical protein
LLHGGDALASRLGVALRTLDGRVLDRSPLFVSARQSTPTADRAPRSDDVRAALLCVQFVNNNMYYADDDLKLLEVSVVASCFSWRVLISAIVVASVGWCCVGCARGVFLGLFEIASSRATSVGRHAIGTSLYSTSIITCVFEF